MGVAAVGIPFNVAAVFGPVVGTPLPTLHTLVRGALLPVP